MSSREPVYFNEQERKWRAVTSVGPDVQVANLTVELRRLQRKLVCMSRRLEPTGRAMRAYHEHLVAQKKAKPRRAPYRRVCGRRRQLLERALQKVQLQAARASYRARQMTLGG